MRNPIPPTLVAALALSACNGKGDDAVAIPSDLAPLEDNTADYPEARSDEPYPEELVMVSGEADEYYWTHARGYVHASLADTWAAWSTPEACIDRRVVGDYTITEVEGSDYDVEFIVHNVVYDIITVEFDNTWRQDAVEGTADAPELVYGRWAKTDGTTYIDLIEGSLELKPVEGEDAITEVSLIEHLDGATSTEAEIEAFFTDMFDSVVALAHGEPLPTYE